MSNLTAHHRGLERAGLGGGGDGGGGGLCEKGQVWVILVFGGVWYVVASFPLKHCSNPFSLNSVSPFVSLTTQVCVKWCKINSESCQAKD